MPDDVIRKPKTTVLVEFPYGNGGIEITEDYGKWNELTTPLYTLTVNDQSEGTRRLGVTELPAMALAAAAFRILKEVRQHLPDEALERLFQREVGI